MRKNNLFTLHHRTLIIIYVSAVSLLLTGSLVFFFSSSFEQRSRNQLKDYGFFVTKTIAVLVSELIITDAYPEMFEVIDDYMKKPNITSIRVLGINKEIIACSNPSELGQKMTFSGPMKEIVFGETNTTIQLADEISYYHELFGYLMIDLSKTELNRSLLRLRYQGIITGCLVWLASLIFGAMFAGSVASSLERMADIAESISHGDLDQKSSAQGSYEIQKLSSAINLMTDAIKDREQRQLLANQELSKIRNYLKNIIDSMPSIIIGVNVDGRILQWNQEAEKTTGFSPEDALGCLIEEVFPFISMELSQIKTAITNQQFLLINKKSQVQTETRHADITVYPLRASEELGAVIRVDDVTENEQKEQAFRQSQKMETVGTLAGGLAHDFNNVLGGIVGSLSLIEMKLQSHQEITAKEMERFLSTMKQSSDRAVAMVSQLLTLARKQEIKLESVDLNLLVKHVMKICGASFDKSIDSIVRYFPKPLLVMADPGQIEQALLNICINACHAMTIMKEKNATWGGTIKVSLDKIRADKNFLIHHPGAKKTTYATISVEDNGVGIEHDLIEKIFSPFFTTKRKGEGTGLGLAMVYSTITSHDGFIDIISEPEIRTLFSIYLPAVAAAGGKQNPDQATHSCHTGEGVILVVDDEEILRTVAGEMLTSFGYKVLLAKNGTEAIDLYHEHKNTIDVVLLDMAMPGLSGKDTYRELKKINPAVLVLLASGYKQDARVAEAIQMGVKMFIQKPYSAHNLSDAIKEVKLYT